jgi:hypothetical protein
VPSDAALEEAWTRLDDDPKAVVDHVVATAPSRDQHLLQDPAIYARLLAGARDAVAQGSTGWVAEARLVRSDSRTTATLTRILCAGHFGWMATESGIVRASVGLDT